MMPDLVERGALLAEVNRTIDIMEKRRDRISVRNVIMCIKNAPTVDAVEVVHGQWETTEVTEDWEDVERYHHFHRKCKYSYCDNGLSGHYYCPNCGAKMDGDGNEYK